MSSCLPFLSRELDLLVRVRVVLANPNLWRVPNSHAFFELM